MSSQPLVSIVLPTHNGSRYLEQAIQSCCDQTYNNWELIIVDDASTDLTSRIISEWASKDRRIKVVTNATNKKLPASLNIGFARTKGTYLTWTSDDNCYRPTALQRMVFFLENNPADIVYCDHSLIDENAESMGFIYVDRPECLPYRNCVRACFLYRRKVHTVLAGYSTDLFLAEDYDFWLRASKFFTFSPLHEDLYLYRLHKQSLSEQKKDQILLATQTVLARNLPDLGWASPPSLAHGYFVLATISNHFNKKRGALMYLLRSFSLSPCLLLGRNQRRATLEIVFGQKVVRLMERVYFTYTQSRARLG